MDHNRDLAFFDAKHFRYVLAVNFIDYLDFNKMIPRPKCPWLLTSAFISPLGNL